MVRMAKNLARGLTAAAHMKMNMQHYYKTPHGPKADPVELNLWTMIPMPTTTRAKPEAEEMDG